MVAYERYITVDNPDQIVISGIPVMRGQRLRITITIDDRAAPGRDSELRSLLKTTQALPQAQAVTEKEIAAQITTARQSG
jgi:hypothetical protein